MKKIRICLYALLLCASVCTSCGGKKEDVKEPYHYTVMEMNGAKVPVRFNVLTGNVTALCSDPVCSHTGDSGCVFADMSTHYTVENGHVYFIEQDAMGQNKNLMDYDMENNTARAVFAMDSTAKSYSIGLREEYMHYTNRETGESVLVFYDSGESESVPAGLNLPFGEYDGKYLFYDSGADQIIRGMYLAEENGEKRQDLVTDTVIQIAFPDEIDNDTMLYCTPHQLDDGRWDWDNQNMYSLNLKTGESTLLSDNFSDVYIARVGDWFYYTRYAENPPELGYNKNSGKTVYNRMGGNVWRMNVTTGEEELYLTLPQFVFVGTAIYSVYDRVVLQYINTDYTNETVVESAFETGYIYPETYGYVVIDPAAGTWVNYDMEGRIWRG